MAVLWNVSGYSLWAGSYPYNQCSVFIIFCTLASEVLTYLIISNFPLNLQCLYLFLCHVQDGKVYGRRKTKRKDVSHSGELEDFFLKELCYARLRDPIAKYRRDQERARQKAFDFAKLQNLLCECPICCEDEVLEGDMRHCEAEVSHGFCKNCVKR